MIRLLVCALLVVATTAQSDVPIEMIKSGQIMGKRMTVLNKQVDAFLGIPFAEPISGERRFSLPVAKAPWGNSQIFNATEYGNGCWQVLDTAFPGFEGSDIWKPTVPLSDDCLNLNVWVPYPRPQKSAVLLWVFGGGFWSGVGSLSLYDGKFLAAEEGVIVVTMNYRVGAFGFLATRDPSAPGNQGLYDQAMAMQWVQDNIAAFGGDPNKVTLFGESAGGGSVSLHQLSPVSQNLFQRAGIQSAGPTAPWAYIDRDTALSRAKLLAEALGCLDDENGQEQDIPDMVKCLQDVDANELLAVSGVTITFMEFLWVPVYDGIFLPEDPKKAVENGNFKDCDMIIGSNTNEANFFLVYEVPGFSKDTESLLDYNGYLEALKYTFPKVNQVGLDSIAFQYRPWKSPNDQVLLRDAVDLAVGDYTFTCPSADFAMAYANEGNHVYYYRFEERASNNPFAEWMGVLHGDEIPYIFGIPLDPEAGYNSREEMMSKRLMEFWANFARTGDPNASPSGVTNAEWPEFKVDTQAYIVLDEALLDGPGVTGSGVKPLKCAYWREYIDTLVTQTALKVNEYYQSSPIAQTKLFSDLLATYHLSVPPTHEGPVEVQLGFTLTYFDFVDEAHQQACAHAWSERRWTDPRLRWDPEQYNGTDNILIDINQIWTPDIELYNGATTLPTVKAYASVHYTGAVSYVPSFQINFICDMNLRDFPYDTQKCSLKMGSWHYHDKTLNLTMASTEPDLYNFQPMNDFNLVEVTQARNAKTYPCCVERYIDVTYSFVLKRKSSAYSAKLVLPSVLAGFLVVGTFLVPNSSCERLTVCVVLFLCLLHLLTYIHDVIPTSGDTILGCFLAFSLFLDFFAIILAVISFNLQRRGYMQQTSATEMESNADGERDLKIRSPQNKKRRYLQYFDPVCFILFTLTFIIGLPAILSQHD